MNNLALSRGFLRFASICAFATALTTVAIHLLPRLWADSNTFELQVELRNNPIYITRLWIVLAHCWLVIISMWATGALLFRNKPHLAAIGFTGFLLFAFTETLRTSLVLFALNRSWRQAYAVAQSENMREFFRNTITAFLGVNDALFFIFFAAFNIGLLCYGLALIKSTGWERRLGTASSCMVPAQRAGLRGSNYRRRLSGPTICLGRTILSTCCPCFNGSMALE